MLLVRKAEGKKKQPRLSNPVRQMKSISVLQIAVFPADICCQSCWL